MVQGSNPGQGRNMNEISASRTPQKCGYCGGAPVAVCHKNQTNGACSGPKLGQKGRVGSGVQMTPP